MGFGLVQGLDLQFGQAEALFVEALEFSPKSGFWNPGINGFGVQS